MSDDQMVRAEGELAAEVEALLADAGHLPVPFSGLGEDSGLLLPSLDRAGTVRTAEMRLRNAISGSGSGERWNCSDTSSTRHRVWARYGSGHAIGSSQHNEGKVATTSSGEGIVAISSATRAAAARKRGSNNALRTASEIASADTSAGGRASPAPL